MEDFAVHNLLVYLTFLLWGCLQTVHGDNYRRQSSSYESPVPTQDTVSAEKRLVMRLKANYSVIGTHGRPVLNVSNPFQVKFGLGLIQMSLDEHEKVLSTSMWARFLWRDEYLTWDPNDYEGVDNIKLDPDLIWMPDIMLYNTADPTQAERPVMVKVFANGNVLWIPHTIFRSSCSITITNFPFDEQTCTMVFGSWSHSLKEMNVSMLIPSGIDLQTFETDYKESCAWDVFNVTSKRDLQPPNDPQFVTLDFTLHMRRKHVFSTYILTLPCVFLAALTLVVFWLPPDRPDRTSLAMNIFASFLVLLLILVEAAPPTASSVPSLGVYYCFNMVIIMMSIFLSSMVVNVSRMADEKRTVSPFVEKLIINFFARWLCPSVYELVRSTGLQYGRSTDTHGSWNGEEAELLLVNGDRLNHTRNVRRYSNSNHNGLDFKPIASEDERSDIEDELRGVKTILFQINKQLTTATHKKEVQRYIVLQWRTVSIVMDRLFFMLYFLAIIASISMLFPRPYEK